MTLRWPWLRRRVPAADSLHGFPPAEETCPPWPVRLDALRTASALQFAWLDGRRGDVQWLMSTADRDVLQEVTRQLLVTWTMTVVGAGQRDGIRGTVAATARQRAAMPEPR